MAKSGASKPFGGRAAREGKGPLWKFTEANDGTFVAPDAHYVSGLYFPLCNRQGMKCSVTPELKGDICSDFDHYLTIPIVTEDLPRSNASRNFWVAVEGETPWSATGVSAETEAKQWTDGEPAEVTAGVGWFAVARTNEKLGLQAKTTVFVPAADDYAEVMHVELSNVGRRNLKLTATAVSPIFGRMADNLRDHRQVTTMFSSVEELPNGVCTMPSIVHDETGHRPNDVMYAVQACTGGGAGPRTVFSRLRDFCGEGGSLASPEAVYTGATPPKLEQKDRDGMEAVAAMRFSPITLKPGKSASYIVLHCIGESKRDFATLLRKYGDDAKAAKALEATKAWWRDVANGVEFRTGDTDYNNWMKWVSAQLMYRKIYGNSYLPDFGYGRGGRGWRDLWSDLLSLFLIDPEGSREEIVNNFRGVRVDGSNATIIGTKPGEFVADRNDVVRTWSDHGAWPLFVLDFYMQQTGDFDILFTPLPYWKDHLVSRTKAKDEKWSRADGNRQKTSGGKEYEGTILEHVLLMLMSKFFHVGKHNNPLLEGGDWNDTYDNARKKGETVCFYNFYAWDLKQLADTLELLSKTRGLKSVELLSEMLVLLDRLPGGRKVSYSRPSAKRKRLEAFFESVSHNVRGKKKKVKVKDLVKDLRAKAKHAIDHIRTNEWITTADGESFFNGHYDDHAKRVHGDHPNGVRMDLTSQVLPTIFGVATDEQTPVMYRAVRRYLRDSNVGGLRLCSDFGELKLDFGRVTGFAYGHKEHGSIWNQQNAMYLYGLYRRGFVREGYEVFQDVFHLVMDSARGKVFPCMPSYFTLHGKGEYCYLTGSATFLLLAGLTQVFGARGEGGDLRLQPKLLAEQFDADGKAAVAFNLHGKRFELLYVNPRKLDWGGYAIAEVKVNGKTIELERDEDLSQTLISRERLLESATRKVNSIEVTLA